jgi:hypothetical protein
MSTLRNHVEMIDLNPLVVKREPCSPPPFASSDELSSTWYAITDQISYLPGGLAKGHVTYHGCFHDLPEGLQTHVYAPLGLDIRSRWLLGGSLPGEPRAPVELGLDIPTQGLYLRENVDMKCNIVMAGFVKKNLKNSHASLVERLVGKATMVEVDRANAYLVSTPHSQTSQPSSNQSHSGRQTQQSGPVELPS